jgi:hypothetical protein
MQRARLSRTLLPLLSLLPVALASPQGPTQLSPEGDSGGGAAAPLTSTTIVCNGSACGGSPTSPDYLYEVTPGSQGVDRIEIGVHTRNPGLLNVVLPATWTVSIMPAEVPDDTPLTPHGSVTPQTGGCNWVIVWTGDCKYEPFQLGYDKNWTVGPPHDVHWSAYECDPSLVITSADWTKRVGTGAGPVHSPYSGWVPAEVTETQDHGCIEHDEDDGAATLATRVPWPRTRVLGTTTAEPMD